MKRIAAVFVAALMTLSFAAVVGATPTIAKQTGKQCTECHGTSDTGSGSGGPHAKGPGGIRIK